ncbi:MAG TPA: tetratricopeptide repeat protein [Verrucomicrobiota bacterium]|jgi:predicted Zn-dependent protease|nr:tetratricopeptide repeat protein [Verrucomicrobiota bacterium]
MTTDREEWRSATRATIDEYVDQVRFARAAQLAQSDRYLEAEGILCSNGHLPENPHELDLLARIAVHQGRNSQARRLWEAALSRDPKNETYQECLTRLGDLPRFRISFDTVLSCIVWITIALSIATLLYVFLPRK